ncbi:MAG: undecaprenyl/decaprenyl-phosphate alpha-N-acetylglucosaminyl 1-phosphate transferase [Ignavibacteriae bacterium]|nr:undecaprenyl/decaprenyl-phosphate alpha-N-acetylglucosaminyl 1-phosphate transferase [Ignavibacteriota bacterium]NOH00034.1 undecaprenyl/decaprenyl-phosphate alpha-N-acetylglucosaminyl 1-phosphate transferase [Ignavibacteriota bacterium]
MKYPLIFFAGLVITIFLTPYLITFLQRFEIVDKPDRRRINTTTIPRMGGVIIFVVIMLLIFSFFPDLNSIRLLIVSALLISVCGTLDDILTTKWHVKFLFIFIAALFLITYFSPSFSSLKIFGITLPSPLDYIVLCVFMVGVINSVNLLDGLDGLASGFSLLVFSMFFVLASILQDELLMVSMAALTGTLLGFLNYNAHPAKIFLGDTGSLLLGFFLLFSSVSISNKLYPDELDLTFAIIVLGVPIIDTLKVMLTRVIKRKNPFHPDKTHIHHVIFGNKIEHKYTVFIVQGLTIIYLVVALLYFQGFRVLGIALFAFFGTLQLFIEPIFTKVKIFTNAYTNIYEKNVLKMPHKVVSVYKKIWIPLASAVAGLLLVLLIPVKTTLSSDELVFLMIMAFFILTLAFIHYKRTKEIAGIFVLLNTAVFLILSSLSESIYSNLEMTGFFFENVFSIIFSFIILSVIIYIFMREKIFGSKEALLTGIDLIMILFVALLFVINNIIGYEKLSFLNMSLYQAYILYLLFKVIARIKENYAKYIFTFSFVLPFVAMLLMFLGK